MNRFEPQFLRKAIAIAEANMESLEGGPFGAVIVKDGEIIATGNNKVTSAHDPSAHAEVVAIRNACKKLNDFQLTGCELYSSCEPCPMCLGAIYWARLDRIYYAASREDAAHAGFDDSFIYQEIPHSPEKRSIVATQALQEEAVKVFKKWIHLADKTEY
ncbi:MAG: tRNA-specific adenosine deaminase [Bacteroidetes bacterium]|nr:MAG: tRNA-specific adenosine deaminase [Bacteroidota bacterium]